METSSVVALVIASLVLLCVFIMVGLWMYCSLRAWYRDLRAGRNRHHGGVVDGCAY